MAKKVTAYQLNRFRYAWALKKAGWTEKAIGKELGVKPSTAREIALRGERIEKGRLYKIK